MKRIELKGQTFRLLHQKAAFWEEEKCLIVSDLHLGKGQHFRKGGVALPRAGDEGNLRRLKSVIEVTRPAVLLLLGDLFHSSENAHLEHAEDLLARYPAIVKKLVIGNHDIMDRSVYQRMGLELYEEFLEWAPFRFAHEPVETPVGEGTDALPAADPQQDRQVSGGNALYNISGHIHPGVRLRGRGRQALTLPCYWFGAGQAILPAFGNFTGLYRIRPCEHDQIYAIADRSVLVLKTPK